MKKIICLLWAMCILSVSAFAMPSPTKEFYVNDFADVIDEQTEKHILNVSSQLAEKTKAQVVVTTVKSLDGMNDSDYALKMGREWGIGDKDKNNGVLILLSLDGSIRIEVGYGLEGALPDGKCGRIIDEYMMPYFTEKNYSDGILKGYDQTIFEVCNEYGIEVPDGVSAVAMPEEEDDLIAIIIAAIIIIVIIFSLFIKTPPSQRGRGGFFMGGFYGGYRGGGFGGSSGGGFSGGGGSFGGGGAGRRF